MKKISILAAALVMFVVGSFTAVKAVEKSCCPTSACCAPANGCCE